jgi:hypothetical protein
MPSDRVTEVADPQHLTGVLRRSGALPQGRVASATILHAGDHILSHVARLGLAYEGGDGPPSLIVKTGLPALDARGWHGGRHEVDFYAQVAALHPGRLVPLCHEAAWDADSNGWHLLLEDLGSTHVVATAWPLPPTFAQCEAIVQGWARMHALWWDHPQLATTMGAWPDDTVLGYDLDDFGQRYGTFAQQMGDRLPPARAALYEAWLRAAPGLLQRQRSRRHLTIVHGDAHAWNMFLPRDGGDGVRLFDWDSWRIGLGAGDLAYMIAMHWYPEGRRQAEGRLLDAYHAALVAGGVTGYSRHDLSADYRLAVLWHLAVPVTQASLGIPPVIWWNNLQRILLAVDDLGCRELLP